MNTTEPPIDEAYEAHATDIRQSLEQLHERLADSRRGLYIALDELTKLRKRQCGSDCCEMLDYGRRLPAIHLLEEADRDITAAIALTGGQP